MWQDSRMVVLCAISAALYAAVLVPFKVVPFIPGITELRPANAIPVVCSFLFGPAAAWGAAIGNLIGDFFGGVGPGDIFGFAGNLVYGYVPYKLWEIVASGRPPLPRSAADFLRYALVCLAASLLCADLIGWGDNMLALRPFGVLGNIIVVNNMLAALVLSPLLLLAVYPRVERGRLLYRDILGVAQRRPGGLMQAVGVVLLLCGELGAWLVGNLVSTGRLNLGLLPASLMRPPYDAAVALGVAPFLLAAVGGLALL